MANLRTWAEFKNCKLENPSLLFGPLAQYLEGDKRRALSLCPIWIILLHHMDLQQRRIPIRHILASIQFAINLAIAELIFQFSIYCCIYLPLPKSLWSTLSNFHNANYFACYCFCFPFKSFSVKRIAITPKTFHLYRFLSVCLVLVKISLWNQYKLRKPFSEILMSN